MQADDLEKRVAWWKWGIAALAAALVIAYAMYFGWHLGQRPALDAEKWGQFGDFVGGLLNPVVAFAAFYWFTKSVRLQQKEMKDANTEWREIKESNAATVEISAITTLLPFYTKIAELKRKALEEAYERIAQSDKPLPPQVADVLHEKNRELKEITDKIEKSYKRLEELLEQSRRN